MPTFYSLKDVLSVSNKTWWICSYRGHHYWRKHRWTRRDCMSTGLSNCSFAIPIVLLSPSLQGSVYYQTGPGFKFGGWCRTNDGARRIMIMMDLQDRRFHPGKTGKVTPVFAGVPSANKRPPPETLRPIRIPQECGLDQIVAIVRNEVNLTQILLNDLIPDPEGQDGMTYWCLRVIPDILSTTFNSVFENKYAENTGLFCLAKVASSVSRWPINFQ